MNAVISSRSPVLRAALAVFAVLLNVLMPSGWTVAGPASPVGTVICLASGGPIAVPAAPDRPRPEIPGRNGHCPVCPLPAPHAVALPDGQVFPPPIRFVRAALAPPKATDRAGTLQSPSFLARAPPA